MGGGCVSGVPPPAGQPEATTATTGGTILNGTVRLLLAGDVMLGRGVAPVVALDPEGLFEDVRYVVSAADVAVANLESPLTSRSHLSDNPNRLEADPAAAGLLAAAGFDAMGIANNHAGDAGAASVVDTLDALAAAGVAAVGGGRSREQALQPTVVGRNGLRIAYLAFDATGGGLAAGAGPGVATWDTEDAFRAVAAARNEADLVVVGLHGGVEYSPLPDPQLSRLGGMLAGWGVDVVWGHGSHVAQPVSVIDPDGDGRPTVVVTGLGNFIFDQGRESTEQGAVIEVLAGAGGVAAMRVGAVAHGDLRAHFEQWDLPRGDAVLLDGSWWELAAMVDDAAPQPAAVSPFPYGDVVDAATGDVTGDGDADVVVAYRHPFRPNPVNRQYPDFDFTDVAGRSAHVGVFTAANMHPIWGAGTLFTPIEKVAPCDGAMAVAYSGLDAPAVTATGGWTWQGFGFAVAPQLPGPGSPTCADVDGDGLLDAVIIRRT